MTLVAGVLLSLALATASYVGVERPFLALGDRLERLFWPPPALSRPGSTLEPVSVRE